MKHIRVVFFGSFQTYSVQVLKQLTKHFRVTAVVTTPPKPQGRHLTVSPTPVELFARSHDMPVFAFDHLTAIPENMPKPDFFVVAGYGKRIPASWLTFPSVMAINVHQSLLPYYRGVFPAEWAILRGEKNSGITLLKMSPEFDTGEILVQKSLSIHPDDTRLTLYKKLYDLGGKLLVEYLPKIAKGQIVLVPQPAGRYFYARRLTRQEGFVSWKEFEEALTNNPSSLDRKFRALVGWPSVWTRLPSLRSGASGQATTPQGKRLILIALKPVPVVQLEGKKPVAWQQFRNAYLLTP
ncbi:MAG: methionyl-tRNA formyltransferase [Candidatus Gottesmanbacteria bacterium]|nr:methionyl-tRNA formyltransferase [Candidatus Gottesmanbacteria bacterium]